MSSRRAVRGGALSCGHGGPLALLGAAALLFQNACRTEEAIRQPDPDLNRMLDVPRYDAYEASSFFSDGMTMREPPEGTVRYTGHRRNQEVLTGKDGQRFVRHFPVEVTIERLREGKRYFERICAACHGVLGDGKAVVARHMQRPPPSLHEPRIRAQPNGMVYHVVTHGYGFMPGYASHLDVEDRWAVVTYVRALQRSRHAPVAELPAPIRQELKERLP